MSFTEQDMKKQMDDFAALREEFSRQIGRAHV